MALVKLTGLESTIPMKRETLQWGKTIRFTGALIQWCTEFGNPDLERQKKVLNCDSEEDIWIYKDEWILEKHCKKLIRFGFGDELGKAHHVAQWWSRKHGVDFLDGMNRDEVPESLRRAYRYWR